MIFYCVLASEQACQKGGKALPFIVVAYRQSGSASPNKEKASPEGLAFSKPRRPV
jgi:hypothetical protein